MDATPYMTANPAKQASTPRGKYSQRGGSQAFKPRISRADTNPPDTIMASSQANALSKSKTERIGKP